MDFYFTTFCWPHEPFGKTRLDAFLSASTRRQRHMSAVYRTLGPNYAQEARRRNSAT